jgi:glycosyltransferase involved in cell wall biosynthesis
VYLINLSLGLAGIERRFANIWRTLRARGNVRPILVVPDTLATLLYEASLAEPRDELLWTIPEHPWFRALSRVRVPRRAEPLVALARSRVVARGYAPVWDRIRKDSSAVVHIGMNCSALDPPDAPLVYECVDANLTQLGTRHYIRASARRCIIHCQTDRIRRALEDTMARRQPRWTTVTSPCYFASYPDRRGATGIRDQILVAFVGRLAAEKNPLLFVEAIARVRQSGLGVRALMLGEGPLLADVRHRIQQLQLDSEIEVGFSQNPPERLMDAAIYVTLQPGDNYGSQTLLEAMGAGCAIVATDVGETGRLVDADVGLLVGKSVNEIATAISDLIRRPERAAAMGAAASRRVRTEYTAEIYAAFLESLYSRAVEEHNSGRYGALNGEATLRKHVS